MRKKLLSVLLTLAMMLSLLPATVWAAGDADGGDDTPAEPIAQVGNEKFTKLQDAIDKAAESGSDHTVRLLKTVSGQETVSIAAAITLDLNGKTVIFNEDASLDIDIVDSEADAHVTIKGGAIKQDGATGDGAFPVVRISGSGSALTVADGCTITGNQCGIALASGALTVAGGNITGTNCGVYLTSGALTITGGEISGGAGVVVKGGTLDLQTGGAVNATGDTTVTVGAAETVPAAGIAIDRNGGINVTISGGRVSAKGSNKAVSYFGSGSAPGENVKVSITGGAFSSNLKSDGFLSGSIDNVQSESGSKSDWIVVDTAKDAGDAKVTRGSADYYFDSLGPAIDAAQAGLGGTVTLTGSITGYNGPPITKELTIDLNGLGLSLGKGVITVSGSDGKLTLKDGKKSDVYVTSSGPQAVVVEKGSTLTVADTGILNTENKNTAILVKDTSHVIIQGGKVVASGEGGTSVSMTQNGTLEMTAGTIRADKGYAVYKPEGGTLTIEDGEITGRSGIVAGAGKINIQGGEVKASGEDGTGVSIMEGGTLSITEGAVKAEQGCAIYQPGRGTLTIEDGEITGAFGIVARSGRINVQGGTITATGDGGASVGGDRFGFLIPAAGIVLVHSDAMDVNDGLRMSDGKVLAAEGQDAVVYLDQNQYGEFTSPGEFDATIRITGGLFSSDISKYKSAPEPETNFVPAEYAVFPEGKFFRVEDAKYEVLIPGGDGATYTYSTFEEAFGTGGIAKPGDTVILLKDMEDADNITIDKGITLDLNGNTIDFTENNQLILQANVTIDGKDGSITQTGGSGESSAVQVGNGTATICDTNINGNINGVKVTGGTLTVESGAIEGGENGILVNNSGKLTVNGGTVRGSGNGIKVDGGDLTVESGIIIGSGNGVQISGGALTVKGGSITGQTALYCENLSDPKVISGGIFTGTGDEGRSVHVEGAPVQFISGGTFLNDTGGDDIEEYLDDGAVQLPSGRVVPPEDVLTITFHANGGTFAGGAESEDVQFVKGEELPVLPRPINGGHTFDGWYTASTGGTRINFTGMPEENIREVYAHWNQVAFTVTFDPNQGTLTGSSTATTNDQGKLENWPTATRGSYTFAGWYTALQNGTRVDNNSYRFTADTTVYAHWGYTVTFDRNDGTSTSPFATKITEEDGTLTDWPATDTLTRSGYTFDGWYTDAKDGHEVSEALKDVYKFAADTTVYAHWKEKTGPFTVTFEPNGGKFGSSTRPVTATTGDDGILSQAELEKVPTPTRDGYTFVDWYTAANDGDPVNFAYRLTKDTTVYAYWTDDSGGGTENPGGNTPGGNTPGGNTPGGNTPGGNTPGGNNPSDKTDTYEIWIADTRHGSISASHTYAEAGTKVTVTVTPDSDYIVDRVEVKPVNGASPPLDQSGRRYTFTMPASDVTVDAKFSLQAGYNTFVPPQSQTSAQAPAPALTFTPVTWRPAAAMWDVPANSWAYPAAQWAYQNGYLDTAADGTFRLNDTVSHLQMWRIMAKWLGEPAMDDNSVGKWARQNGAFRIGAASGSMTRQNMVEYLYQCYFLMGGDVSVTGNLIQYRDGQQVTLASAKNAWLWAVNKGIISGTADGYLNPNGILNRGEFASILMRLCQNG